MPDAQQIGGRWCDQVLALLPDFVDGTLSDDVNRSIQAHLAGCANCERFGGAYVRTVLALQQHHAEPAPDGVAERLRERLARG